MEATGTGKFISLDTYSFTLSLTSDWASVTFKTSGSNDIVISSSFASDSGVTVSSDKKTLQVGQKLSFEFQSKDVQFNVTSTGGLFDFDLGHGVSGQSQGDNGGYAELFVDDNGTIRSLGASRTDSSSFYGAGI